MSGKFFTIREDIIFFLIENEKIQNEFISVKEFIFKYLLKNLYFEEGINQFERLTEIHEISKIIKRMEYLNYIKIDNKKKIQLNYSNKYVEKIKNRIETFNSKIKDTYDIFKLNKVFLDHLELGTKKKNNFIIDNEEFKDYEKEFSDDDRDNDSEYSFECSDSGNENDDDDESNNNESFINKNIVKIKSQNTDQTYIVDKSYRTCTCQGFIYSRYEPKNCKHVEKHCGKIDYVLKERKKSIRKKKSIQIEEPLNKKYKDNNYNYNYFQAEPESD